MKISISNGGITDVLGYEAGFAAMKKARIDAVDFGLNAFPLDFFEDEDKLWEYFKEVKRAAEDNGIEFGQFHAPCPSYIHGNEEATRKVREAIVKSIRIASYCGSRYIIVHPCFITNEEEEWEENIRFYSSLIPHLQENGVICCLENMWAYDDSGKIYGAVCSEAQEANRYIDVLNEISGEDLFAFCLDTGHLILAGIDFDYPVKTLEKRLKTLHINDNDGLGDHHLCPYMGVGDWNRFCKALKEIGYQGNLNFETGPQVQRFGAPLVQEVTSLIGGVGRFFSKMIEEA